MKNKIEKHGGRFISLSFKDGNKVKKVCAKVISTNKNSATFQDVNDFQIYTKLFTSFV